MNQPSIIVALDFVEAESALAMAQQLRGQPCKVKVGNALFTHAGPDMVRRLVNMGFDVFLDLKYHDIPNTVAQACEAASALGVWMLNVHTSGSVAMLDAAREAADKADRPPLVIGVTLLTSLAEEDLTQIGMAGDSTESVLRLAKLAQQSSLDGVVCSAHEAEMLKRELGQDFQLVTPGIRPIGSDVNDQKRIFTPRDAMQAGVDHMVIGRPITQAPDPVAALLAIHEELNT